MINLPHAILNLFSIVFCIVFCVLCYFFTPVSFASSSSAVYISDYSDSLQLKIEQALIKKGKHYKPRTKHLLENGLAQYTNRLILEDSPYLLQHAHNPVNWFSWSTEAFALAKKHNKPILLSIGYSTCHWCHVMEEESFENTSIAKLINKHFISIKIDREQRPDIDAIYMQAVQLIAGQGGWPMTVFLTPDAEVIYAGTYYPPTTFTKLLQQINRLWAINKEELTDNAKQIMSVLKKRQLQQDKASKLNSQVLTQMTSSLLQQFDELQGGFLSAPKFPQESKLFYLMDWYTRTQDKSVLTAIETSLDAMRQGGIYDQVGGGFHRYAIDNGWLIPHFEKMLYNQAHLARLYFLFYQLTENKDYLDIAEQTMTYALRDLKTETAGELFAYYAASDADSEGEEGLFYLWTIDEVKAILSTSDTSLALDIFNITEAGNFDEAGYGKNILTYHDDIAVYALEKNEAMLSIQKKLSSLRQSMYQQRLKRIAPDLDKKVLTAWNAMMVTTLSKAYEVTNNKRYLTSALSTMKYLLKYNWDQGTKELYRSSLLTKASVFASQNDYAYLSQALLRLYDISNNQKWLILAVKFTNEMLSKFWDSNQGGFYMDNPNHKINLTFRPKDINDGAIPAGNSIALEVLFNLSKRLNNSIENAIELKQLYQRRAEELVANVSSKVKQSPTRYSYMLKVIAEQQYGAINSIQYGAEGHLKAKLVKASNGFKIKVNLDDGWHINSHQPLEKDLIKTSINLTQDSAEFKQLKVDYPKAELVKTEFNSAALSLYTENISFDFSIERNDQKTIASEQIKQIPIQFNFQACSEKICLKPEKLIFYIR